MYICSHGLSISVAENLHSQNDTPQPPHTTLLLLFYTPALQNNDRRRMEGGGGGREGAGGGWREEGRQRWGNFPLIEREQLHVALVTF